MTRPGFVAEFSDVCPRCHDDIAPGERVVWHKGRVIHVSCASGQDE